MTVAKSGARYVQCCRIYGRRTAVRTDLAMRLIFLAHASVYLKAEVMRETCDLGNELVLPHRHAVKFRLPINAAGGHVEGRTWICLCWYLSSDGYY